MRAVLVSEFGAADRLVAATVSDPMPGPTQVLVRQAAASVNRSDLLFRSGHYHGGPDLPAVPGSEGAGTVVSLGPEVDGLAVGDRVVGWGSSGFYAELAAIEAAKVLPVPDGVSLETAAAMPVAWLSAWYCLHHLAQVRRGQVVLVHAAASGVGSAAIQIAKHAGASVIAVVGSSEKEMWVRALGADEVLDRHADDVVERAANLTDGRGVDVVLDLVGGATFAESLRAVGHTGRVVAMANVALATSTVDTRDFYPNNVTIYGFQFTNLQRHGWDPRPDLQTLLDAVAVGQFTVPIDSRFALADAVAAHQRLESGLTRGKVVLTP
ncbi:MAG: hypothetical protein DLM58_20285 [Pseudonocardiales bacterium]|nr:MAG: hypothetical protein DLM58_20285 [Pseudonocardiales bacterium]